MTSPPGSPPPSGQPPPPYGQPPPSPYGQQSPPYGQPPSPYGQPPSNRYPPPPAAPYPPPPPPPGYYAPAPGGYAPPPKSNSRKIVLIVLGVFVGLVVLVVGGGIALYLLVGKGTVTATDVKQGDCLKEIPDSAEVLTVQTVGCEEPHAGEVFAVLTMPDGDFPGQPAIDEYSDRCGPELESFSPDAMTDDSVQLYVLYPTAETWEQGDRAVTCIATLDPPRAGSIKG